MRLKAIEKFSYKDRMVESGSEFDADERDVAILTQSLHPTAVKINGTRQKRKYVRSGKYARRDMRAED